MRVEIDVSMDFVTIEGQRVNRPDHISRSDWMRFWENVGK